MSLDCQARVIAFPALSLHSRANDVFWVRVCLLSKAKSIFLNSRCSVQENDNKEPCFSGEEVTLSLQHSYF